MLERLQCPLCFPVHYSNRILTSLQGKVIILKVLAQGSWLVSVTVEFSPRERSLEVKPEGGPTYCPQIFEPARWDAHGIYI